MLKPSDKNLRGADLTGRNLYGWDFTGCDLRGAVISLDCATFEGAKFDGLTVSLFLLLLHKADIDPRFKDAFVKAIDEVVGPQQRHVIERYLRLA